MTEPEDDGEKLPEPSAAWTEYWERYARLKDTVVLLSLRTAEWFYDNQMRKSEDHPEAKAVYDAVDDEFDQAVAAFFLHTVKPVPPA